MIRIEPTLFLSVLILFCRIGGCLMFMPGFSSQRIPVNVRLFLALGATLALTPLLADRIRPLVGGGEALDLFGLIVSETLKGSMIGILGRMFFAALETLATFTSMSIGLTANLGVPISEDEAGSPIVTLLSLTATVLLFVTNQHAEVFKALAASYDAIPAADAFAARPSLVQLTDAATKSFLLALRISSPFVLYSIILNVAVAIASRLVPNIPVQFVSVPVVLCGGLLLLYATSSTFMDLFVDGFSSWLAAGR